MFGMSLFVISLIDRHDNDNHHPRSPSQIYESNRVIRDKFYAIFKPEDPLYPLTIPIVPSYGNNDVWPYKCTLLSLM
jgi:endopolyphosphatase